MKFLFSGVAALSALTNAAYLDEWQVGQHEPFTCDGTAWFIDSTRFATLEEFANPAPGDETADMANADVHTFSNSCNNNYFDYYDDPSVGIDKHCYCMPAYIRDPSWEYDLNYLGSFSFPTGFLWKYVTDEEMTFWTRDSGNILYVKRYSNDWEPAFLGASAFYMGLQNFVGNENGGVPGQASLSQQMQNLAPGATYQISVTYGGRGTHLETTVEGALGFFVDDVQVGNSCWTSETDNVARMCKATFTATASSQKLSLKNVRPEEDGDSVVILENLVIGKIADPCATGSFDVNSFHSTSDITGCSQCQLTTGGDGTCGVVCQCTDDAQTASRTFQSFTDCTGGGKVLSVADGDLQCANYCQLSDITGSYGETCTDCSTNWNTDHCNLTCTCLDGNGGDNTSTLKLTEGAPVVNINGLLTHSSDSGDGSAAFSAADLDAANLASERLVCGDASEVSFKQMYQHVEGRYHVDLNPSDSEANQIQFSARGTSGINVALTNSAAFPTENLPEGFSGAYEIFIGPESEPVIHVSECMGCAPKKIANVGVNPYIKAGAENDIYIQVVSESNGSTTIKVGLEGQDADLEYNFIGYVDVNQAVFTYGYGDMECECPETETYSISLRKKSDQLGIDVTYDVMTVNLRTMVATFPEGSLSNSECMNDYWYGIRSGHMTVDLTGTPFQLAKASELALNTNYDFSQAGSLKHEMTGPFYLSGWSSISRVNCSSVQKCTVDFDGRCAAAGIWNFDTFPGTNDSENLYSFIHFQGEVAKLEYVSGFEDDCTGVSNTETFDIDAYIAAN